MEPLMKSELGLAAAGAFGTIGLLWGHVRGIFSRISSFVVVSATISSGYATQAMTRYLWKNFKRSKYGERKFLIQRDFIRPIDRLGMIPFEITGSVLTFFKGWKPIFVSLPKNQNGSDGDLKISFVRGTFNIEQLFIEAAHEFEEIGRKETEESSRYYVKKVFGQSINRAKNSNGYGEDSKQPQALESNSGTDRSGYRMLKWNEEDIGSPIAKEPFSTLAYDHHIKKFEVELRKWRTSEKWHKEKRLPWRLGAGLFGPPGTGKTSFVRAIGQDLDMPIHIYDLTSMNNEELVGFWRNSLNAAPCIVLFEDLDRVFDKEKNIKATQEGKGITLDCLLNCINGVEPSDGILVFVTANDMTKLDSALGIPGADGKNTRPGRLDRAVFFGPLDEKGRLNIAERILSDCPEYINETVLAGKGETGAQFEDRCGQIARSHMWGEFKIYANNEIESMGEPKSEISKEEIAEAQNEN